MPDYTSRTAQSAAGANPVQRIDPRSKGFTTTVVAITVLSFAACFFTSSFAQLWVGEQVGLPEWARLAVPLAFDLPMIGFALGGLSRRSQGRSTWTSSMWLAIFTMASIAGNAWHGLSVGLAESGSPEQIGVLAMSVLVPLGILATSEQALSVLVAPPVGNRSTRQALARVADQGLLQQGPARRGSAAAQDRLELIRASKVAAPETTKADLKRAGFGEAEIREALS